MSWAKLSKMTKKPGQRRERVIVFTHFQADNYGTSSGDDEGTCVFGYCLVFFGINNSGCQS